MTRRRVVISGMGAVTPLGNDRQTTWEGLVAETVAFGSPDTVIRKLETMRDMGVGQVLCWMNFGGLAQDKIRRSMELFAREVMPHFRG